MQLLYPLFFNNLSMLPTCPRRNRPSILCPCVSVCSECLLLSVCFTVQQGMLMSWGCLGRGAWVYTVFPRYIIYPSLLQAITRAFFSAGDAAQRRDKKPICPSLKTHLHFSYLILKLCKFPCFLLLLGRS